MDTDRNLLFGVLALQVNMIDISQFADACSGWAVRKQGALADLLVDRSYLSPDDRKLVEQLLDHQLRKHGGDARSSLGEVTDNAVRQILLRSTDAAVVESVNNLPPVGKEMAPSAGPDTRPSPRPRYSWINILPNQGDLGRVWLAHDGDLNREVALKEVHPKRAGHPEARRSFLKEAQVAGQLEHPNIVPVYDFGYRPEDDRPFYVMRLIRNETLAEAIDRHHRSRQGGPADAVERRRLLGILLSVCNAVAYAHSRGVVHRDLKPQNVVLGDFGEVQLLDWGLAKVLDSSPADARLPPVALTEEAGGAASEEGRTIGSWAYMSPEQAEKRHSQVGPKTDVYGLGAILFEILTGRPPHVGKSTKEVEQRIIEGPTPSAREADPTAPPELDRICARAMAKEQADRFGAVPELAREVQVWLDEEPIMVYRAGISYFEKLVQEYPRKRDYREGLARELVNLGLVLRGMNRQTEARQAYRDAITHYEVLLAAHPAVLRYRADLAACRIHLYYLLRTLGRKEEAEQAHHEAIADYDKLVQGKPGDRAHRSHVASMLTLMGHDPDEVQKKVQMLEAAAEEPSAGPPDEGESQQQVESAAKETTPDFNLLFGVLALQMDFISREALIQAMQAWVHEKPKPLGQILVEQRAISPDHQEMVNALVKGQLERQGKDAQQSQAAVSSVASVRDEAREVADPDVSFEMTHYATIAPAPDDRVGQVGAPVSGPRYRILRPHARGGLGTIFVAHDEALNREVAVKEIVELHGDHPEVRARFLREAEITAGLEHPGVISIYSLGQYPDGRIFYAMRLIKGDTLEKAIREYHQRERRIGDLLEMRTLLRRVVSVCITIAYAHSRGILHRDLKPGNVMLGKYGETLVVDWGLAKPLSGPEAREAVRTEDLPLRPSSTSPEVTRDGQVVGTPAYMSPEQAAGNLDLMGPASDVYGLGATLYTLLTGKPPFSAHDIAAVLLKARRGEFLPPRKVNRRVPRALEAVCLKAMALRPIDRYPSAGALADDIEHWLADEPVKAWRDPWYRRLGWWVRRHPVWAQAVATVLVIAVLVVVLLARCGK